MRRIGCCLAAAWLLGAMPAAASERIVAPGGTALREAAAAAQAGDVLVLAPGIHDGPVEIRTPLTLKGQPGAIVDGRGEGKVISVLAPDVTVQGLVIRNSGTSLEGMHSGVFVGREGARALIEGNEIERNLFGVYLWGPADALVRNNRIRGRADLRSADRGNGVSVWNAPGSKVIANDIREARDGIFSNTSRDNVFSDNRFTDLRFAVHYMYTNKSEISRNVSIGNHIGYAIMYSQRITLRDNASKGDRDHGILLNFTNDSQITGNAVTDGGEKCVFIYNSNKNTFARNWFDGCETGIHFTAGSERNVFHDNAFLNNRTQVKYVGTRRIDWSYEGRGNYWSDNPAFDLDGDGVADLAYRPNDIVDRVVWAVPAAKLLLNSPAVQVVRWAQAQFPAVTPGGVLDSAPLMRPPSVPGLSQLAEARR